MQPNVDVVNIVQIPELAAAPAIDLTWLVPMSSPVTAASKKVTLLALANVISNQIGSVTVPDPYTYRVGGPGTHDPAAGATTINDPVLDGLDYAVDKWGVGYIRKGTDWQNDVGGGGFRIIGATFVNGETYVAIPKPKISNIISSPDAIARFTNGIALLPSSTTIGAGNFRKLLVMNGAAIVTLPLCSAYPPNVGLFIEQTEGPRKESTIQCQGADVIYTQSGSLTNVFIGQREFIVFITDGVKWYIQSCSQRIFEQPTAQDTWSWGANTGALNTIPGIGQTLNRADYPGVWDFVSKLSVAVPSAVVSGAVWNGGTRTYWGTGDGSTTFNTPDIRGLFKRVLDLGKGVDPSRDATEEITPGSRQSDELRAHSHTTNVGDVSGRSDNANDRDVMIPTATRNVTSSTTGGAETRPVNVGFYPLIYI